MSGRTLVVSPNDPPGLALWGNAFRSWGLECSTRNDEHGTRQLVIDRADPVIRVQAEVFEQVLDGHSPFARLTGCPRHNPLHVLTPDQPGCSDDCTGNPLLRIEVPATTLIYRITEYVLPPDLYVAEWPD